MIIGHLAAAVIIKHFSPQEESAALLMGSVFPDIGDKGLKYAWDLKEGRSVFHSLLGSALAIGAAFLMLSSGNFRSFLLGYIGHIVIDSQHDVPWFYPFYQHQFGFLPISYSEKVKRLVTQPKFWETLLTFWSILILLESAWEKVKNATTLHRGQGCK